MPAVNLHQSASDQTYFCGDRHQHDQVHEQGFFVYLQMVILLILHVPCVIANMLSSMRVLFSLTLTLAFNFLFRKMEMHANDSSKIFSVALFFQYVASCVPSQCGVKAHANAPDNHPEIPRQCRTNQGKQERRQRQRQQYASILEYHLYRTRQRPTWVAHCGTWVARALSCFYFSTPRSRRQNEHHNGVATSDVHQWFCNGASETHFV